MGFVRNQTLMQWISFLLVLLAFPLLYLGVQNGVVLAWVGMAMVALGLLIPPALRLVPEEDGEEKEGGDKQ